MHLILEQYLKRAIKHWYFSICNFVVLIGFPDLLFFINLFQLYEMSHNPELDKKKNMDESMDA